ncbi:MAG: hypothetical protein H8E79_09620 [Desulfobulbaceae bacterium]|uniref:Uncharacterized protein n=1 Tax=Candidatus Desulfatifera sulfidica TaxID=2841691 RepID=A0A8J6TAX7_9BACT|nr:hypothetical protein [Candidatus Desulfatifera sulfidica]
MKQNTKIHILKKDTKQSSCKLHRITLSEGFWFTFAFALFLLAGPFAAPVVIVALYRIASSTQAQNNREPNRA